MTNKTAQITNRPVTNSCRSAPASGVVIFWASCVAVLSGFLIHHPISFFSFVFIIPLLYGSHEALHDTLIPREGFSSVGRSVHNGFALVIGFALQGMNFRILRPSHLHHHAFGRYDDGYAPDIVQTRPTARNIVRYYLSLCGFNTLLLQASGFAMWVFAASRLP